MDAITTLSNALSSNLIEDHKLITLTSKQARQIQVVREAAHTGDLLDAAPTAPTTPATPTTPTAPTAPATPTTPTTAELVRANMGERVTIESLVSDCPELRKLTVGQLQMYSKKEVASRFILRAFVSRALSGSAVDWQDKSVKGALLTTAEVARARSLETKANEWKGKTQAEVVDAVNELLLGVHSALLGTATKAATSELEKARKYIKGLSAETLAALRKDGII